MNVQNLPPQGIRPETIERFYLSGDGHAALGPFTMAEVKRMLRCRYFLPEVLIRSEHESSWSSYRHRVSKSFAQKVYTGIVGQFSKFCWLPRSN